MKLNKKYSKKRIILSLVALLVISVGVYVGVAAYNHLPPFTSAEKTTYKPGEQVINLERSGTEKKAEQTLRENPEQKTQNDQRDIPDQPVKTDSEKLDVNVLLTNAGIANGTVSASGMVTNLVEEGGTCTYTFTNGGSKITKESKTLLNPTSTTCSTVRFSADELPISGTWKVTLTYNSDRATGMSTSKELSK